MSVRIGPAENTALLADVAVIVSRSFLTSPVFVGIDAARYRPEAIEAKLSCGQTLIAVDSGRMLGSVTLFPPDPESLCEAFRGNPQLGLLAVDPSAGGRGIGHRLIAAAESKAVADGHVALALSVTQRGSSLIALYKSLGYWDVATFHRPQAVDPSQIMVKTLVDNQSVAAE